MDKRHATRMGIFPNVILHGYKEKMHSLKMLMQEENFLHKILFDSLKGHLKRINSE